MKRYVQIIYIYIFCNSFTNSPCTIYTDLVSAGYMAISLLDLVDNLAEGIHKINAKKAIIFLNTKV